MFNFKKKETNVNLFHNTYFGSPTIQAQGKILKTN